jgi:2-oxo-4-hydroxy-4-carboxy-5-ureidoimidazoline decarboxylase
MTAVDAMDRDAFASALGWVVEHSPWVAERAWERRPFGSREGLALAFEAAIRTAPAAQMMQVLRAHPELGGREAAAGALTAASTAEQRAARLDKLSAEEAVRLAALNRGYRERFGFPFIACVREHTIASLFAWAEARLRREPAEETVTAVAEVGKIIGLRLREQVSA